MIVILILASLFPLWAAWHRLDQYPNDDTFITLTFAKNLAHGNGFVFNQPPATSGATSPLWTMLVAGVSILLPFVSIVTIAIMMSAFFWVGIAWVIFIFRRSLDMSDWQAAVVALSLTAFGWVFFLGMEAYLFAFLLVISAALFFRKNHFWAGITSGLLFLTRGEGFLFFLVLTFFFLVTERKRLRKLEPAGVRQISSLILGFMLPAVTWGLYSWRTFGVILPNTLAVKIMQAKTGFITPFYNRFLHEWILSWGFGVNVPFSDFPQILFWWALAITGLVFMIAYKRKWLVFPIWICAYIAGYSILGVAGYPWYELPVLFVLLILSAQGINAILEIVKRLPPPVHQHVKTALAVMIVFIFLGALVTRTTKVISRDLNDYRRGPYTELGDWFKQNSSPDQTIAYVEIGYLGFITDNRLIDLEGLTTPDIVPHLMEGDAGWGFWHYRPDFFIDSNSVRKATKDSIIGNAEFQQLYRPVYTQPFLDYGDIIVYRKIS